jgi:glycosyltransferase involved in cell wall biosynthesis
MQGLELALRLINRGHQVWLACTPETRLEAEASSRSIPILAYDVTGYLHPRIVWRLGKFIARNHIDVIHCQLSKDIATIVPAVQAGMSEVPIVLTRSMGSYISKKDLLHQYTYGHVALVLAVSSVIHRNVLDTTPMPPERVMTFPYGVDLDQFSPEKYDRDASRSEFGIDPSQIVVGLIGRFSPGKGHEELLQAAAGIRKRHRDVRFLIVGEASNGEEAYAAELRRLYESLELGDAVIWAGFRSDVPRVLSAMDILAFPSHAEAFGVVLIEAMAMGLPVVSSNCDGVLDIVVDGETGVYIEPRNPGSLAEGLEKLVTRPELRRTMGEAGRKRVEKEFDQNVLLGKLEEIYRNLKKG